MIGDRRVLAVVPARGGSKGVHLKNLRTVLGISLVARVGGVVREIPAIDSAVVSTDHPEIARVAEASGLAAPFFRPIELSGDRISDWQVLSHAHAEMEALDGAVYDLIVMLQPTSPMRTAEHVVASIQMLVDGGWDSVWTVSPTDTKDHPLKQLTVTEGAMEYYDHRGKEIIARQQLETLYHRNGVAYVMTRDCLVDQKMTKGRRSGALVLEEDMVSIDTERDFRLVEFLLSELSEGAAE